MEKRGASCVIGYDQNYCAHNECTNNAAVPDHDSNNLFESIPLGWLRWRWPCDVPPRSSPALGHGLDDFPFDLVSRIGLVRHLAHLHGGSPFAPTFLHKHVCEVPNCPAIRPDDKT